MEHNWILDTTVYYEAGKYDNIADVKFYTCKNCGTSGRQNRENGNVECFFGDFLSCEEGIIKNIIE